jgi:predicted DNA-binding transcriptional regulator AlpA
VNTVPHLIRFADLKAQGVVTSWPQLKRLVDGARFPPGFMLSPHVRVWDAEDVTAWVAARRGAAVRVGEAA